MGNTRPDGSQDADGGADHPQSANPDAEQSKGAVTAQVRVLCKDGEVHTAIYGYGANCEAAYANAQAKAAAHCHTHGGVQKLTRVKCPFP